MNKSAVFFDRDGIVNIRLIDKYVLNNSQFKFNNNFFELFKLVKGKGFLTILITNQQGIGKKLMTENDLSEIHNYMQNELLTNTGFNFDDIFYCTSLKEVNDFRRKPNPGMILEAIHKHNINASKSFFIGDSESDIIAGNKAELTTIYINNTEYELANYNFTNLKQVINFFENLNV